MILTDSEGFELKDGFKNDIKPEVRENLKGRFNEDEILILIATFNSLIFTDQGESNKELLLMNVQACIGFEIESLIEENEKIFIEKLQVLNNDEIKSVIQMVFECIKRNMLMEKKLDELISEIFGV